MIALDTSIVVAAFGAWHEHHRPARGLLDDEPRLPAHSALEAYSVMTRLPEPFRADPGVVVEFLRRTFPTPRLVLGAKEQTDAPDRLHEAGITGGAVYDGLIALSARAADAEIVTLDRRAMQVYDRCGARARLLV